MIRKNVISILVFFSILPLAQAAPFKFKHIRLKFDHPKVEKSQKEIRSRNSALKIEKKSSASLNQMILRTEPELNTGLRREKSSKMDNIFTALANYIRPNFQKIGQDQTDSLQRHNQSFDLGQQNFSGFTWQRPFGNFRISVYRQILPDFFSKKKWIVVDTFLLHIDAKTFLTNLKDLKLIDLPDNTLMAYAGINFTRTYKWTHFANSYKEGLTKDLDKLFLTFTAFLNKRHLHLSPYEMITKEDYLSGVAGVGAKVPLPYQFNLNVGAILKGHKMSKVQIQTLGREDQKGKNEWMRISHEKERMFSTTIHAELAVEFLQLLKISLLSFDFEYSLAETNKTYLSFNHRDKNLIRGDGEIAKEVQKLAKFKKFDLKKLTPFIQTSELRQKQLMGSRYSVLMLGGIVNSQTELVRLQKKGVVSTFFRHHYRHMFYIRSFWAWLVNTISKALLKVNLINQYLYSLRTSLALEYKNNQDSIPFKELRIDDGRKISLEIGRNFQVDKTKPWYRSWARKKAVRYLKYYGLFDDKIVDNLEKSKIYGPLNYTLNIKVNSKGILHFINLSKSEVLKKLAVICSHHSRSKWKNGRCYSVLEGRYLKFYRDFKNSDERVSLWRLKNFMRKLLKYSHHLVDFQILFGEKVFYFGHLEAKTDGPWPFTTYFKLGNLEHTGVIDEYIKKKD